MARLDETDKAIVRAVSAIAARGEDWTVADVGKALEKQWETKVETVDLCRRLMGLRSRGQLP